MTTPIEPASTERAAFEKWLMDVHMLDSVWNEQRNCFDDFPAHLAFKAWQAALAQTAPAEVVGRPEWADKLVDELGNDPLMTTIMAQGVFKCHAIPSSVARHIAMVIRRDYLSTPTQAEAKEKLGRFGHHPDPANDFCIEVEALVGLHFNALHGISKPGTEPPTMDEVQERISKAMDFTVGGDEIAVKAKQTLRAIAYDQAEAKEAGTDAVAQTAPAEVVGWPALDNMGKWLSAALDDDTVCAEMKADINAWFASVEAIRSLVSTWRQDVANDESLDRYSRAELACASELEKAIGKPIAHYQGMGQEIRPLYTHPTPIEPAKSHDHWRVSVETSGELIVAIEPEMLAGREPSEADYDAIRTAANHLLAFAGAQTAPAEVVDLKKRIEELETIAGERYIDLNLLYQKLEDAGIDIDALQAPAKVVGIDAVDNMIDSILSDETPAGPENQPNIDMFNRAIESAKCRLHNEAMVEAAYKAAVEAMRGTSADVGAGELDRIVRAIVSALSTPTQAEAKEAGIRAAAYWFSRCCSESASGYVAGVKACIATIEAMNEINAKRMTKALRALLTEGEAR